MNFNLYSQYIRKTDSVTSLKDSNKHCINIFYIMKKLFVFLFVGLTYISCGPGQKEYDALCADNEDLKNGMSALSEENEYLKKEISTLSSKNKELGIENSILKSELENYRNTPGRLYEEAVKFIEEKDIASLTKVCNKLGKYHPGSCEYKESIFALYKLVNEKNAKSNAEKAKRMQAVNRLNREHDDISGITWYYNPYFTHYNDINKVSLYIGQKGKQIWLRLKMSYEGKDWIFFNNAYLSYDGKTKEIPFNEFSNKKSDNAGGYVWEWIDVAVDEPLLSYLNEMVEGKSLKMRLSGKYTNTRNITKSEKKAMEDILLAYDVLKNEYK